MPDFIIGFGFVFANACFAQPKIGLRVLSSAGVFWLTASRPACVKDSAQRTNQSFA